MMKKMTTTFSLPIDMVEHIDQIARELHTNKSKLARKFFADGFEAIGHPVPRKEIEKEMA